MASKPKVMNCLSCGRDYLSWRGFQSRYYPYCGRCTKHSANFEGPYKDMKGIRNEEENEELFVYLVC